MTEILEDVVSRSEYHILKTEDISRNLCRHATLSSKPLRNKKIGMNFQNKKLISNVKFLIVANLTHWLSVLSVIPAAEVQANLSMNWQNRSI